MSAIELSGVTKQYGDVTALQNLDLEVEEGEIFGFLGPNGAGKSTTIDILMDFVKPTAGDVRLLGHDAQVEGQEVRQKTGLLPEGFGVYDRLTGRQHVEFAMESKGVEGDPDALLERVDIAEASGRKASGYSKGMKQRLALAMALVGSPDLLILDEPSTGLDPNGAREMRQIIRDERDRGATVFFSSHILEQVDAVCDRVGILRKGELVAEDTIQGLRQAAGGGTVLRVTVDHITDEALDALRAIDGVSNVSGSDGTVSMETEGGSKTQVLDALESAGLEVQDFATEEASLEDLFAAYTEGAKA